MSAEKALPFESSNSLRSADCVVSSVRMGLRRVCSSATFSMRRVENRRHCEAFRAFGVRCLRLLKESLAQLRGATGVAETNSIFLQAFLERQSLKMDSAVLALTQPLLRVLWGGVHLLLQLESRSFEQFLGPSLRLAEQQLLLLSSLGAPTPSGRVLCCLGIGDSAALESSGRLGANSFPRGPNAGLGVWPPRREEGRHSADTLGLCDAAASS